MCRINWKIKTKVTPVHRSHQVSDKPSILQSESGGECVTGELQWAASDWDVSTGCGNLSYDVRDTCQNVFKWQVYLFGEEPCLPQFHSLLSFSTYFFRFWFAYCLFLFPFYQSLLPSLFKSFSLSIPQAVKWLPNGRMSCLIMASGRVFSFPTHPVSTQPLIHWISVSSCLLVGGRGEKLTNFPIYLYLVLRLRTHGAIPLLTPSCDP
jgi:hypothetical protein